MSAVVTREIIRRRGQEEPDLPNGEVYLRPSVEKDLRERLLRIEGHLRGLRRMLEEHQSCDNIVIQLSAVKAALTQVTIKLVEGHMDTCVREGVARGEGDTALADLKRALSVALKRL